MESALHRLMKTSASKALALEGYLVFEEPSRAPSPLVSWAAYRPDVFALRATRERQEYALVECETRPSPRRLSAKNVGSLAVQTRLNSELSLRMILVIPRGSLARLDPSTRLSWETWIHDGGLFQVFPKAEGSPLAAPGPHGNRFSKPSATAQRCPP